MRGSSMIAAIAEILREEPQFGQESKEAQRRPWR
jgi:hypothetical protein